MQARALAAIPAAWERGVKRLLLTSPTGTGKTRVATETIQREVREGGSAILYSDRKMLIEQLMGDLDKAGIPYGVRSAGHDADLAQPVQISSLPTERRRVLDGGKWAIHGKGKRCLALVDEAHRHGADTAQQIFGLHYDAGHRILGITATPLGMADLYDELFIAGTVSEGRECGALVKALHYGPDEPDTRFLTKSQQDMTEPLVRKLMMQQGLFGRVLKNYEQLNPEHKATILFAPGVQESVWFAEQFAYPHKRALAEDRKLPAIPAAHIDGECVWVEGETYETSPAARQDVLEASKDGTIRVLANRFVLREGIDCPWLRHAVFATIFGSLQSYLQAGGRLLRADVGKASATVQDHGGNWWRHGSLNEDRHWQLDIDERTCAGLREEKLRNDPKEAPFRCEGCGMILRVKQCPTCGWAVPPRWRYGRPVVQRDGTLTVLEGAIYKPRVIQERPDTAKLWKQMYYRALRSKNGMTFRQAEALFVHEFHHWPPRTLPLMPRSEISWFRKVRDVPREELL